MSELRFFHDCCRESVARGLRVSLHKAVAGNWLACCELCDLKWKELNGEKKDERVND